MVDNNIILNQRRSMQNYSYTQHNPTANTIEL